MRFIKSGSAICCLAVLVGCGDSLPGGQDPQTLNRRHMYAKDADAIPDDFVDGENIEDDEFHEGEPVDPQSPEIEEIFDKMKNPPQEPPTEEEEAPTDTIEPEPPKTEPAPPEPQPVDLGVLTLQAGRKYLGKPYKFGASRSQTENFDCSSFVYRALKDAKLSSDKLPRTARAQAHYLEDRSEVELQMLPATTLKPGDIIYWKFKRSDVKEGEPTHTGFYVGQDEDGTHYIMDAHPSHGVSIRKAPSANLSTKYFYGAFRLNKKLP